MQPGGRDRGHESTLPAHARELLEAEISALRAQVIALGGDPDAAVPTLRPLESNASVQLGVSGSIDTVSVDNSVELPTNNDDNLLAVDPEDLDFLPKFETDPSDPHENDEHTDLDCPYCENAAKVGGNRSKRPRKDNCIGAWCVLHCLPYSTVGA